MQTKTQSFIEAITNTAVGFGVSLAATFIIFPLVGVETTAFKNIVITIFFTVISILRSYILRRYFNSKPQKRKRNPKETDDKPFLWYDADRAKELWEVSGRKK